MSTDFTSPTDRPSAVPPPAPSGPAQRPEPSSGGSGRTVAIVVGVVGGAVILGTALAAGLSALLGAGASDDVHTADVRGVAALDVDVSASEFAIVFGDVDEAVLEVTGSRSGWSLSRDGRDLSVDRRGGLLGDWWFVGDWLGGDGREESVVLTLPESLREAGLDGDLTLSGGSLSAEGAFGELDIEVGAGYLSFEGSATDLDVDVSAGRAELAVDDVSRAGLSVAAGRLDAELTGDAPSEVAVEVSAGQLDLTLPEAAYAVDSEVTAGSFDNRLDVSASSRHGVSVDVSAGQATVRAAG
ncbi:hypothetical protein N8K70_00020 [Microbacterium betulae]|uniref:Adhesin domain-containing protein n=1 Tax=Microbacterium betulae TaxID=2981139 RepID=A0AA97FI34_9MICO|nr:hypothetical protein [Microbacterium sp. AB]WOF23088.1 hypothetical protein N8K70_00020 [Microbacterium sp. AB]